MKKSRLTIAVALVSSLSLTQCVVPPPPPGGPPSEGPAYYGGSAYPYGATYAAGPAYRYGYGATGRVATNAMWAGVTAYGIHERNETRQDRINHSMNNFHGKGPHGGGGKPQGGGARPPGGGGKPSGGARPPGGGGGKPRGGGGRPPPRR